MNDEGYWTNPRTAREISNRTGGKIAGYTQIRMKNGVLRNM
jgi:hypothetical protein